MVEWLPMASHINRSAFCGSCQLCAWETPHVQTPAHSQGRDIRHVACDAAVTRFAAAGKGLLLMLMLSCGAIRWGQHLIPRGVSCTRGWWRLPGNQG